ncbi:MAG TPA: metal-sensing transcriptional repressor [Ktedonobacteraceae bacterium]
MMTDSASTLSSSPPSTRLEPVIQKMVEEDRYCVEILRQTYAVRMAIAKLEALLVEQHLQRCVPHARTRGQIEDVIAELVHLYALDRDQEAPFLTCGQEQ